MRRDFTIFLFFQYLTTSRRSASPMPTPFCRLTSPCHFPEFNRGLIHRQRNCGRPGENADLPLPPGPWNYFLEAGAFGVAGGMAGIATAGGGSGTKSFLAESGSLSALATKNDTCQICVSSKTPLKVGIPVSRMPFFTFQ